MHPKIIFCLALILSGCLVGCSINKQPDAAIMDRWGETAGGFQMATALDETNGIIHCWIRNATTNEINYPSYDFGYAEFVTMQVQLATNWISLKPWVFPKGTVSEQPSPYFTNSIKAGQVICDTAQFVGSRSHPVSNGRDELIQIAVLVAYDDHPDPSSLLKRMENKINGRWEQLTNLCRRDTYALDFVCRNPFAISGLTNHPPLRARTRQKFRVDGSEKMLTLH